MLQGMQCGNETRYFCSWLVPSQRTQCELMLKIALLDTTHRSLVSRASRLLCGLTGGGDLNNNRPRQQSRAMRAHLFNRLSWLADDMTARDDLGGDMILASATHLPRWVRRVEVRA
ncbi:hypothetical protein CCR91_18730 [Thiorhodovibrio winogradskyi]|nr:hypothetical protein [Thiorhodovibrio winogradskyi]